MGAVLKKCCCKSEDEPDNISLNVNINCGNICCSKTLDEKTGEEKIPKRGRYSFKDLLQSQKQIELHRQKQTCEKQWVECEKS